LRNLAAQLTQAEHKERRRIAEILHEDLQQRLVAIRYRIGALKARERKRSIALEAEWLLVELADVIRISRDLTTRLRPPVLYDLGLRAALAWLADQMRAGVGLDVRIEGDNSWDFESDDVRVFVFEAVSELLLNVVKHAGVRTARVRLQRPRKGMATLVVEDKGAGFNTEQVSRPSTFGLFSIRERIEAFGGHFEIVSRPGRGTRVAITLPIAASVPMRSDVNGKPRPKQNRNGHHAEIVGQLMQLALPADPSSDLKPDARRPGRKVPVRPPNGEGS
jgi:signal transduction histidine kinase